MEPYHEKKILRHNAQMKEQTQGTTVLTIEGPSHVQKSNIAEEFARNEHDSYIMIDFLEENDGFKSRFT